MKKIMLIYPPGNLYQRGEERCQSNVESSTATSIRACNDLGYAAAVLKENGYNVFLKDYQTEKADFEELKNDFLEYSPNMVFVSITNATIFQDIQIINCLKEIKKDFAVILKGAIFFNPEDKLIDQLDLKNIDYLIGGESEFIIGKLANAHFDKKCLAEINGILYKKDGKWLKTNFETWEEYLDNLPFPDRSLMKNELYFRPDTGEPLATISASRGCPSSCIFCLTPVISGKKVRFRSPENVFKEIEECYKKYNIKNFFFKADTFTINKKWVLELCKKIINSDIAGKIEWTANSRVNPIDLETLQAMKKAGCWLVAFGFESGSAESIQKMNKGAKIDQNMKAAELAKKAGLKVYGFYLIGFPWEDYSHLKETEKMIFDIDADFIELHLATPFYGTELYKEAVKEDLIDKSVLGRDYFNAPTVGTKLLSIEELQKFRKKLLLKYHIRPFYLLRKLISASSNPKILKNYFIFGTRLIKNLLT